MATVVSVFELPSNTAAVVRKLKARGFGDLTTYSPAPFPEIELAENPNPSGVRVWTLVGGLVGVFLGFLMQFWMSLEWPLKIAGKAYTSVPPMMIISFELTILFAGVLTLVGFLVHGGLIPRPLDKHYSPRFSAEDFGVVVEVEDRDVAEVQALMRAEHAKEVTVVPD